MVVVFTPYLLSLEICQDYIFIITNPAKGSPDDDAALSEILELEQILDRLNIRHRKLYRSGEILDCLGIALKGWP